jgi:hypothetical protein
VTRQWRALFASPVWSIDAGIVPIGDVVAGDVWWGPALQQAYKPSVQPQPIADSLSTDGGIVRSWCLFKKKYFTFI